MKLISWNVNGIRAVIGKGFVQKVEEMAPDILHLQEIKSTQAQAGLQLDGYHAFWNPGDHPGYSGTALFSRIRPREVRVGLPTLSAPDDEGRVITAEFDDFYFVGVYTPNASQGLVRLDYRINEWDPAFRRHCKDLEAAGKPVVFCGDLNVAHTELDIARPDANRRSPGFTDEERNSFTETLDAGFVDTFRHFHPGEPNHYSWWSFRANAKAKNIGWRLDYFCVSPDLLPMVQQAFILKDVAGSDHCPVGIELD